MKAMFGGAIALVLLGIYVHLLRVAYLIVDCASQAACTSRTPADFNDVMAQSLTVIGGLVSALVIAELAITKAGEAPAAPFNIKHMQESWDRPVSPVEGFFSNLGFACACYSRVRFLTAAS